MERRMWQHLGYECKVATQALAEVQFMGDVQHEEHQIVPHTHHLKPHCQNVTMFS